MLVYLYIFIGILAIVVFFVMLIRTKKQKAGMQKEDEWMQSLPPEEWGMTDEDEEESNGAGRE
ncbi:MAG: hypothetical protein QME51_00985 [Planctomycetota bacterium]|nr:hypothetical protein [Planctomycetota bacterium]MDI6786933.1 hypothetical protein [Planctomycetota bacterium]